MARTRQIKPEFFLDDELAVVSRDARLLFIGLWTIADREGRLEDRPLKIKAQLFPYDLDLTYQKIDALLNQLWTPKYIYRYQIENHKYIQIRSFSKHQRCHMREMDSTIPAPTLAGAKESSTNLGDAQHQPRCSASTSTSTSTSTSVSAPAEPLASHDENPSCSADCVFTEIPCNGSVKIFHVSNEYVAEMRQLYPGIDIEKETLRAKGWNVNNPTKRKTAKGMTKFLGSWYTTAQNDNSNKKTPSASRAMTRQEETFAFLDELATREENAEPGSK
jgi:hypothetical protein